jgi:hypothetical protein
MVLVLVVVVVHPISSSVLFHLLPYHWEMDQWGSKNCGVADDCAMMW